jgi:hypothetical protein
MNEEPRKTDNANADDDDEQLHDKMIFLQSM